MDWQNSDRVWAAFVGLDPLAEWVLNADAAALAPGNRQFFSVALTPSFRNPGSGDPEKERAALAVPFLLTPLPDGPDGPVLLGLLDAAGAELSGSDLQLPSEERLALGAGGTACILAAQGFFSGVLAAGPGTAAAAFRDAPKAIRLSSPVRADGTAKNLPAVAAPVGDACVLGIIDDGMALGHRRFRNAAGATRIRHFWDQDADWGNAIFPGREIDGADIDAIAGAVSHEDAFYADAALAPFFPLRRNRTLRAFSHGTQVLDLAAGADPGAAAMPGIIAVKLPRDTVLDTSGGISTITCCEGCATS